MGINGGLALLAWVKSITEQDLNLAVKGVLSLVCPVRASQRRDLDGPWDIKYRAFDECAISYAALHLCNMRANFDFAFHTVNNSDAIGSRLAASHADIGALQVF